jgi:hypothetical protein
MLGAWALPNRWLEQNYLIELDEVWKISKDEMDVGGQLNFMRLHKEKRGRAALCQRLMTAV